MNETEQNKITTSGLFDISTLKNSKSRKDKGSEKMDSGLPLVTKTFTIGVATREIMDIRRRRNQSPETRSPVAQRNARSGLGTLRSRYDHQTQRTIFAPSRPNKQ